VLLGLGALGAGAFGARALFSIETDTGAVDTTLPTEQAVASVRSQPTPSQPAEADEPVEAATAPRSEPTTTTTLEALSVVVACRAAWGAEPVSGAMVEHVPVRLTLHHTAVGQTAPTQGPARARQHQRYHQSLGWPDLAYHFLVDRTGLAYEGRDVRFRGDTGTEYDPTGHFLVCMEGDFDVQEPTSAQIQTTVELFAWASQQYGIEAATLAGHGSYAVTSCPGSFVVPMIPDLAAAIAGVGPVAIDLVCGSDGADLVSTIEQA
jgi:hypothetical protein